MKAEYKRDLQNNYLILELSGEEEEGYHIRMAEQNTIQGLLPFHSARKDGKGYLHYEITSKQPLKDVYEKKTMDYQDIISLLAGIETILETMQRYLLNPAQLVFDPQYMFLEPGKNRIWLCYLPGAGMDTSITLLAEFILKRLNHEDRRAVMLGYSFYQEASQENFSLQQTLKDILISAEEEEEQQKIIRSKDAEPAGDGENSYESYIPENCSQKAPQQPEEYQVTHKERYSKENKTGKLDKFFKMVHPAVLLSSLALFAVLEILFYMQVIHLMEAGGLFFLVISVEILANKFWKQSQKKKKEGENRWITEEENEMYRMLQKEMYEEAPEAQVIEETRCLTPSSGSNGLLLVPSASDNGEMGLPNIPIGKEPVLIGKIKGESDILLNSPTVSRIHARLECRDGRYFLKDLNSKNGTFHNGRRLHPQEQCEIAAGDRIAFAEIEYRAV